MNGNYWQPAKLSDCSEIEAIGRRIYINLNECTSIVSGRIKLFPAGCWVFRPGSRILGYAVSHPWTLGSVPPLNHAIVKLPSRSTCIYLHDVAVLEEARGLGASTMLMAQIKHLASSLGLGDVTCVAVMGSQHLWEKNDFTRTFAHWRGVRSYGRSAKLMRFRRRDVVEKEVSG